MEGGVENGKGTRVDDHESRHMAVAAAVVGGVAQDRDAGVGGGGGRKHGHEGG